MITVESAIRNWKFLLENYRDQNESPTSKSKQ